MCKFKMLGVAVVAVLAMSILAGAGTASATTICQSGTTTAPCPSSEKPYSGTIEATLVSASANFKASFVTINCNQSTISGTTNSSGSESISAANWLQNGSVNCPNNFFSTCASSATGLNWTANAVYDSTHAGGRDGYLVTFPKVNVVCSALGQNCNYIGNNASGDGAGSLRGDLFNSNHHLVYPSVSDGTPPNLKLSSGTGGCSATAAFTATYDIHGKSGGTNVAIDIQP